MDKGHTNRVPEILETTMELQALYPSRDTFHIDEVNKFYSTTIRYFLDTGNEQQAKMRLDFLEKIDPESEAAQFARNQFMLYQMKNNLQKSREKWDHDRVIERKVKSGGYRTSTQTDKAPVFHHQEIDLLYRTGFDIDEKELQNILNLPRETVITDLETVLEDTINRFEYFRSEVDKNGWDDTRYSFSVHALHLLAELGSEQSLPAVLELLRQGNEFLDFWYFDSLESFFNSPTAQLATQQVDLLDEFLREPDNNSYARNIAVSALEQMAMWYPELKKEVTNYYEEWLKFLVDHYENERIYDTELLCFIIWSCINLKAEELLPLIKTLYDQDSVLLSMLGTYPQVERDIKGDFRPEAEPESIFEIYSQINMNSGHGGDSYANDNPDKSYPSANPENPTANLPPKAFQKQNNIVEPENDPFSDAGRNDPCPCGSGRKYKKCCL